MTEVFERAICIGAGLTGLCIARVLSEHFKEVLILERRPARPGKSHAVHADHLHNLIDGAGIDGLEELFPGFEAELTARGCRRLSGDEVLLDGDWMSKLGLETVPQRGLDRNVIDSIARERVEAIARCRIQQAAVRDLLFDRSRRRARVTGVVLDDRDGRRTLEADLVVDASGRRAFSSRVLKEKLGIEEEVIVADSLAALMSCRFKRPAPGEVEWTSALHLPPPPASMIFVHPLGDREWLLTVYTRTREPPPCTMETLLSEAKAAGDRVFGVISKLEPTSKVSGWRATENVYRRHLTGARLPERLLVAGDAACATNPLTSSGMSVSAVSAIRLKRALARGGSLDDRLARYNRELERFLWRMWQRSTYFELRELIEAGEARGTFGYHLWRTYLKHVLDRAQWNERLRLLRRGYLWFDADTSGELFAPATIAWSLVCAAIGLARAPLEKIRKARS